MAPVPPRSNNDSISADVSTRNPPASAAPQPDVAVLLARYRDRLIELVALAEAAAPAEPAHLRAAVDLLVENLNEDLLKIYRATESGALKAHEAAIVVPAFERLRNVLRHRDVRLCSMRDTLHKAVTGMPPVSHGAQAGR